MSTAASPRLIVVDDTDTSIQYSGPWFADYSGSQDNAGDYGPVYKNTLHGTTLNASLAYNFNGTKVKVVGSNNLRNDSGVLDPTWNCFVDGISIGVSKPFAYAENNWRFCGQDILVDGTHVLTVNATVMKSQTFWLDQIQYVPSANVPLDNKTILIDSLDLQLQSAYGSGWRALGGNANMTTQTNSIFTFNFTGISLSWYGYIPTELPHGATTATYSVDGKAPVTFILEGLPANSITVYNQKFFETDQLAQGNHQIVVLFQGNEQTTPLTLDYLLIQNGTTPQNTTSSLTSSSLTPSSSTPSSSTPSSSTPSSPTQGHSSSVNQYQDSSSNIVAISGSVAGAVTFMFLVILIYLLCIRHRENRISLNWRGNNSSNLTPRPFMWWNVPMETSVPDGYATKTKTQGFVTTTKGGR